MGVRGRDKRAVVGGRAEIRDLGNDWTYEKERYFHDQDLFPVDD